MRSFILSALLLVVAMSQSSAQSGGLGNGITITTPSIVTHASELTIKVEVSGADRESTIKRFEALIDDLRKAKYARTSVAGGGGGAGNAGGGGGTYYSVEVKGPPPKPLTPDEIDRIRGLIKD